MYKSNKFCDILGIGKGVTAIIGSGGKTSLMMRLAEELAERGKVIVCTSTHIMRPENMAVAESAGEIQTVTPLAGEGNNDTKDPQNNIGGWNRPVCVGTPAENGKLTAPKERFEELAGIADYVLVEADGAKRLPLKCHAPHEPVIPENADKVILVIGLSGIGKKAGDAVHRPEIFENLTGLRPEDTVTAAAVAKAVRAELPGILHNCETGKEFCVFINQADSEEDMAVADRLAAGFEGLRCFSGAVRNGEIHENTHQGRG